MSEPQAKKPHASGLSLSIICISGIFAENHQGWSEVLRPKRLDTAVQRDKETHSQRVTMENCHL